MMGGSIRIGRVWGIPVGLHWSWFIIFTLVTFSLSAGYFPAAYPDLAPAAYFAMGLATSLLFFASVLVHELGHTLVALRNNVLVREINLFIFGGVAWMSQEPRTPGAEFRIAIAGPAASLLLAGLFAVLYLIDRDLPHLAGPTLWLAYINTMLAVFNMLPGFPLDGGRVLRAAVWYFKNNLHRATQIAAFSGQVLAFGFIIWGVVTILGGNFLGGLWLALIGWFLQNAAASHLAQSNLERELRDVTVNRVMRRDFPRIPGKLTLQKLVDDHILSGGNRFFFVFEQNAPRGIVTLNELKKVAREHWSRIETEQVMVPWERLARVEPQAELLAALRSMDERNVAQLPVVEDARLVGVLTREHVLHHIRLRAELGIMDEEAERRAGVETKLASALARGAA